MTVTRAVDGGYRVTANWGFVSGYAQSQWVAGLCRVFDGETMRTGPDGQPAAIFAFVPRAQTAPADNWYTTGMRGTGSVDVAVTDLFVPCDFVVDFSGGPSADLSPVYYFPENVSSPAVMAAIALGTAKGAIAAFTQLGSTKRGTDGLLLKERAHARAALGAAHTRVREGRAALFEAAEEINARAEAGEMPGPAEEVRCQLAAIGAVEAATEAVDRLYRAAATSSVFAGGTLDRAMRDLHTLGSHAVVQESNLDRLGAALFE